MRKGTLWKNKGRFLPFFLAVSSRRPRISIHRDWHCRYKVTARDEIADPTLFGNGQRARCGCRTQTTPIFMNCKRGFESPWTDIQRVVREETRSDPRHHRMRDRDMSCILRLLQLVPGTAAALSKYSNSHWDMRGYRIADRARPCEGSAQTYH